MVGDLSGVIPARDRLSRCGVVARPLGLFRVSERPADAYDQLGRKVGVADVGRAHALLELKGTSIVPRWAVLGLGVGHDNDAWHVLLAFGSKLVCVGRSANRLANGRRQQPRRRARSPIELNFSSDGSGSAAESPRRATAWRQQELCRGGATSRLPSGEAVA